VVCVCVFVCVVCVCVFSVCVCVCVCVLHLNKNSLKFPKVETKFKSYSDFNNCSRAAHVRIQRLSSEKQNHLHHSV